MNNIDKIKSKIYCLEKLQDDVKKWKKEGEKIVFTNGCFDILHKGHIEVLAKSADLGSKIIVGVNSDKSVKNLKGIDRPVVNENSRSLLLASLNIVDAVIIFNEETPINLIKILKPDILTKGGDYSLDTVVGNNFVNKEGGKTVLIPLVKGSSSTQIIEKIKKLK